MTLECFEKQIGRLSATFGDRNYPLERAKAMFGELREFTDDQFEAAVSHFIVTARHAPLLPDFIEALNKLDAERKERERMNTGLSAADFSLRSVPTTRTAGLEFVRACRKTLTDYQSGKLNRAQFDQACDWLEDASHGMAEIASAAPCRTCQGGSVVSVTDTDGISGLYRCHCRLGELLPAEMVWKNSKGEVTETKPFYRLRGPVKRKPQDFKLAASGEKE